jgi:S-DNA-T family DNA segregation ATPase FtsK/SpoIIIE
MSPEHKMDILGVFITLLGLLLLVGMISGEEAGLFVFLTQLTRQIAGFGALLVPIILIIIGIWFVLRNETRFPAISTERLLGVVLLVLNLFTWTHWFSGGGWDLARQGSGGGYLGAIFERLLVALLGDWGSFVVLLAWLLLALALTFDVSIPDLLRNVTRTAERTRELVSEGAGKLTTKKSLPSSDNSRDALPGNLPLEEFETVKRDQSGSIFASPPPSPSLTKKQVGVQVVSRDHPAEPVTVLGVRASGQLVHVKPPEVSKVLNPSKPPLKQNQKDQERTRIIEETLALLNAPAHVVSIQHGPTFTQFCVEPGYLETRKGRLKVRVSQINSCHGDLALALSARSVRVEAPIPGRPYIGIEVPNEQAELVTLREALENREFRKGHSRLRFVVGKDVGGKSINADLVSMPHLLIAGATNSGKSVCLNSILACYLLQYSPEELRLVLVDPKQVELTNYNGIPHLLTPVIVDAQKVPAVMRWLIREMDSRLLKFKQAGVRNLEEYNATQPTKIPFIVLAIDELADMMMLAPAETEEALHRLAQMSRATGIHLIIATQRPSVDVLTGKIKANFPARITFAMVAGVDSRVAIDQSGASQLVGRGDMLFQTPELGQPMRLQGAYVSNDEIERLIQYWKGVGGYYKQQASGSSEQLHTISASAFQQPVPPLFDEYPDSAEDQLFEKAIGVVRREEKASISLLQRKLGIGYMRAARLIERLEEMGVIGKPSTGSGVRPVLDFGDDESNA